MPLEKYLKGDLWLQKPVLKRTMTSNKESKFLPWDIWKGRANYTQSKQKSMIAAEIKEVVNKKTKEKNQQNKNLVLWKGQQIEKLSQIGPEGKEREEWRKEDRREERKLLKSEMKGNVTVNL